MEESKKKFLGHEDWVRHQFKNPIKPHLKEVLVHAFLIEAAVINEADLGSKTSFGNALSALEEDSKYQNGLLDEIRKVKTLRDELAHAIIKNRLNELQIREKIYDMRSRIKRIHRTSGFIMKFFQEAYRVSLFDLVVKDVDRTPGLWKEEI